MSRLRPIFCHHLALAGAFLLFSLPAMLAQQTDNQNQDKHIDVHVNSGKDDSDGSKELKCDGDNTGNIVELKVGTQDHQHVVSVEPAEKGSGSTFALVYVHTRSKQGDI
jgi:hypothetical protein